MVTSYLDAIRRMQPDGPYRLAGWSMGGMVASEMARRLEESGEEVALLALLDAPFTLAYGSVLSEEGLAALFVSDAARALGRSMTDAPDPTASVADQLRWLAAGSEDGEVFERRYAVFRAHLLLIAGHEPRPVRGRTIVVSAAESPNQPGRWLSLTGDVHAVQVPGDHYTFLHPPGVQELAAAIRDANG
jgi:thioesterase domain-containing protein